MLKLKRFIPLAWLPLFIAVNATATETDFRFEAGLAFGNGNALATPTNIDFDDDILAQFSLGASQQWHIDENWRFDTALSVTYATTNDLRQVSPAMSLDASLANIGIWADTSLVYKGLWDSARPFVQLGVGKVYGDYQGPNESISGWETGYRALAGMEFDLTDDMSLRIAVGEWDVGDLD